MADSKAANGVGEGSRGKKKRKTPAEIIADIPTETEAALIKHRLFTDGESLEDLRLVQHCVKFIRCARGRNSSVLDTIHNAARLEMLEMFLDAVFKLELLLCINPHTDPEAEPKTYISSKNEALKVIARLKEETSSLMFHIVAYTEAKPDAKYGHVTINFHGRLMNSFPEASSLMLKFLADPEHLAADLDDVEVKEEDE